MRKLMLFTIGFAAACVIGTYFYSFWLLVGLICGLIAVMITAHFWNKGQLIPVTVVAIGAVIGLCWFGVYHYVYLSSAAEVDGTEMALVADVSDYGTSTEYGVTVKGTLILQGKKFPALFYLKDRHDLKPGDSISGTFRLRLTHEGIQGHTYHRGNGIFLLAYAQGKTECQAVDTISLRYFPAVLRRMIADRLDLLFSKDTAFFAKALLLGDRSDLDYETSTAFKLSGISHIIAVSGLHVSILYSVIYLIAGRRRLLTAIIGIPILICFAAVTGFTPSVTRACVMQILFILADCFLQEYDPPTALSSAVLVMLVVNPVSVSSASLQLSVGCMAGIFLFSEKIRAWICNFSFWRKWKGKSLKVRFRNWLASGISITVSSMFFTTPLVAYYFGSISLVGILTNLLTLWTVSLIFYGIMISCVISMFWQQAAAVLVGVIGVLIRYVLELSKCLSSIPLAAVYTKSVLIIIWLVLSYALIVIFLFRKNQRPYILICSVVICLTVSLLLSWIYPLTADCCITVLDVGQGQSILLQADGKTYMVDCGGDDPEHAADQAAETLLSMGIYRLDGIILTHYDSDHAAGIPYLIYRVPADHVFLPEPTEDEEIKQAVVRAAGSSVVWVRNDMHLSWQETKLSIFSPLFSSDDNESGLCVLFHSTNCDILITGDLGINGENKLVLDKGISQLTGLIAGHHGSSHSTGESLLVATKPQYVFVSVGEGNPYGHPSQQVLDRLDKYHCRILRTDQNGTIVFRR